jgi:formylglycine-generating enzyme required for sulfatase activity
VGSWPGAREVPCGGPAPEGAICIPGGLSILGEPTMVGTDTANALDPIPLQPALLSPFFLDGTEVTVARFRTLLETDDLDGQRPLARDLDHPHCSWTADPDPSLLDYPLNCLSLDLAERICTAEGGRLPSEAEWEHAARGRGRRYFYPWGNEPFRCCAASAGRREVPTDSAYCPNEPIGPEPAGAHADPAACEGLADVSRDGVLDLAGSLTEPTRDAYQAFDAPCWNEPGIHPDPVCTSSDTALRLGRGGDWASGPVLTLAPLRAPYPQEQRMSGVRCAYPAAASEAASER